MNKSELKQLIEEVIVREQCLNSFSNYVLSLLCNSNCNGVE